MGLSGPWRNYPLKITRLMAHWSAPQVAAGKPPSPGSTGTRARGITELSRACLRSCRFTDILLPLDHAGPW